MDSGQIGGVDVSPAGELLEWQQGLSPHVHKYGFTLPLWLIPISLHTGHFSFFKRCLLQFRKEGKSVFSFYSIYFPPKKFSLSVYGAISFCHWLWITILKVTGLENFLLGQCGGTVWDRHSMSLDSAVLIATSPQLNNTLAFQPHLHRTPCTPFTFGF